MDDLLSKAQRVKTVLAFSTIGLPLAITLIVVGVITTLILFSTPGISGEQTATSASASPSPIQSNSIFSWQSQITDAIRPFYKRCYDEPFYVNNVMLATITNGTYTATKRSGSACGFDYDNTYFCTNLVIDSYKLAGVKNSFTSNALAVKYMIPEWETIPGGSVRKDNDVRGLIPGDAVFWLSTNDAGSADHVGLISQIDVDSKTGNGYIVTNDANTNKKSNTFYVRSFGLIGDWLSGINIPWFGLAPR